MERDPALERRFQLVTVEPPSVDATTSILRGLRPRYEAYHGITISEGALVAAASLSSRYISGRHLPDKAIDCLDEAAAQVKMEGSLAPELLDSLERTVKALEAEEAQLERRAAGGEGRYGGGKPGRWRRGAGGGGVAQRMGWIAQDSDWHGGVARAHWGAWSKGRVPLALERDRSAPGHLF